MSSKKETTKKTGQTKDMGTLPTPEFYGSTTVGERGQIVLPAKLRKAYGIGPGDRLLVLGHGTTTPIMLFKADVLSDMMTNMNDLLSTMSHDIRKEVGSKKGK
jgi:AbrB family looped-hinge helix DNA binding protein